MRIAFRFRFKLKNFEFEDWRQDATKTAGETPAVLFKKKIMQDDLIRKVANLMSEQTSAYTRLESATNQLSAVMMRGEPHAVEILTKAGEKELLTMRSRLLEITSALTAFAEIRAGQPEKIPLNSEARASFEKSAKDLLQSAKAFQKTAGRASSLALGGSSFATACIQMCGLPPTTYNKPVLKYAEGTMR